MDGAVRLIVTTYDGQGNADRITSYDGVSGGNIVNEVYRTFNGLGQLTAEYQSHSGGVNTMSSPKVQYAWTEMPSGANHSRLSLDRCARLTEARSAAHPFRQPFHLPA